MLSVGHSKNPNKLAYFDRKQLTLSLVSYVSVNILLIINVDDRSP
jgi:hypothetical protein